LLVAGGQQPQLWFRAGGQQPGAPRLQALRQPVELPAEAAPQARFQFVQPLRLGAQPLRRVLLIQPLFEMAGLLPDMGKPMALVLD
jgi:hypothetical protein